MKSILPSIGVISETVKMERIITPFADGPSAFRTFLGLAANPKASLRTMIYGATLQIFFDDIIAAKKAGADVKILFDHTQAAGHYEKPQIERLVAAGFVDGTDFLIGTSPDAHNIIHLKSTVIITPDGAFVEDGSWNYSDSATKEMNDLCFTDSADLATYYNKAFGILWTWIQTHEPQYQVYAKPLEATK